MNDPSDQYEDVPAASLTRNKADGQSPGEILREARLRHEYSVADLCAQTKLSEKTVRALEDNDFQALSQPVFARGYYRQCAKVLDIDVDRLMAAYTAWGGDTVARQAAPTAVEVVPEDVTPRSRRAIGLVGGVIALLVVVLVVLAFLPGGGPGGQQSDTGDTAVAPSGQSSGQSSDNGGARSDTAGSTSSPADAGAGSAPKAAGGGQPTSTDNVTQGNGAGANAGSGRTPGGANVNETLGLNGPNNAGSSERVEPQQPQVAPNHLVLDFTGRSWIDVRDASGSRLLTGIFESGATKTFDGKAPYRITLGYAPGVDVSIGGKAVDVASQTADNATARLTVEARDDSR